LKAIRTSGERTRKRKPMRQILDCLVNYFGPPNREGMPLRYFFYHILGGPGPTAEGGVAHITTLAVSDERERCATCQMVHAVQTGGPAAAIAKAIRYLDAWHEGDRLRKVQSPLRGLDSEPPASRINSESGSIAIRSRQ
jgi:hypothetical protein